jgi:hypothetical protein
VVPVADAPLQRPIDVAFHPLTGALHVLDFGRVESDPAHGVAATAGSGVLWTLEGEFRPQPKEEQT